MRRYTDEIELGLEKVTVNADSWEDVALLDLLQRFFTLRATSLKEKGAKGKVALAEKYHSLRRLIDAHRALRAVRPAEVEQLRLQLKRFDKLRRRFGVEDYQLHLEYRFGNMLLFTRPHPALGPPDLPARLVGLRLLRPPLLRHPRPRRRLRQRPRPGRHRLALIGLFLFPLTWAGETALVDLYFGWKVALTFGLLLPPTAGLALKLGHERKRIPRGDPGLLDVQPPPRAAGLAARAARRARGRAGADRPPGARSQGAPRRLTGPCLRSSFLDPAT